MINETSWRFPYNGTTWEQSVDDKGNYISTEGAKVVDYGRAVVKDGKACYTSAITGQGEICWTNPKLDVGGSGQTVDDRGEMLLIQRIAYVPKTMSSTQRPE